MRIVVIGHSIVMSAATEGRLRALGELITVDAEPDEDNLVKFGSNAEILVTWGLPTAGFISQASQLKLIVYLFSGYDGLLREPMLISAVKERGIDIAYVPGYSTEAVSEFALALFLMLGRRLPLGISDVAKGVEQEFKAYVGTSLNGASVGVVGLGKIGFSLSRKAYLLGANIRYICEATVHKSSEFPLENSSIEEIFACSNFIVISCPLTEKTRGSVDRKLLESTPLNAVIVNVSRAEILNLAELGKILNRRPDLSLAIDAFEPNSPFRSALIDIPNCMVTPHIAAMTNESLLNCTSVAATNIEQYIQNKPFNKVEF